MKQLQHLLKRYLKGKASEKENLFVERYYDHFEERQDFSATLDEEERNNMESTNWQRLIEGIEQQPPSRLVIMIRDHRRWIAAAAILLIIAASGFWLMYADNSSASPPISVVPGDVQPGKDGATLTLADGSRLVLDNMGNGVIANQSGSSVMLNNNQVTYSAAEGDRENIVQYNTLTTPAGRQFHIQLPDGTDVWLNAASSIRYPTSFTGNERKVTISGEAYFEVATDKRKPFLVDIDNKATVEVLGTHFNINSYSDERNVQTTLLEGSIKIRNNKQSILLKPSQQVVLENGTMQLIEDADINIIMAWKNGSFRFRNTPLQDVLRQLSRWYDVEVSYQQHVPQMAFTGAIKRNLALSEALRVLEVLGVNFSIEGKHLIVKPPAP